MKQTRKRSEGKLQIEKYCPARYIEYLEEQTYVNAEVIPSTSCLWSPRCKVLPKNLHIANSHYLEKLGFQGNNTCILVFLTGDFCHTLVFLFDCQRVRKKSAY